MTRITKKLTAGRGLAPAKFLLAILLVLATGKEAADLTWKFLTPPSGVNVLPIALVTAQSSSAKPAVTKTLMVDTPLFGQAALPEESPPLADTKNAPVTSLNLILRGIVAVKPKWRALAIIGEKQKRGSSQEEIYALGDTVPGGAVIEEILGDRVILRRGTSLETLLLDMEMADASSAPPEPEERTVMTDNILEQGDGVHWQISNDYWQKRLTDLPSLAREVGVEIYKEGEVQKGYRLVSARGSRLLTDLGLKPGDVLHEVNGIPLDSVYKGLSVYDKVKGASEVRVVVSRDGQRETRIYNISDLGN
ncbi:MAG: hypothetical protein KJ950_03415 [Proteobacteria bacterium]|nr:hypothetical protein [Pseudomonadota bacterium]MBU1686367.1 hypothetical protein [Pseudomonadota bacterium]